MEENRDGIREEEKAAAKVETAAVPETDAAAKTDAVPKAETASSPEDRRKFNGMVRSRGGLYLRTAMGAIIAYYACSIVRDIGLTAENARAPLYLIAALFGAAGVWIILDSLKRLIKKEYDE